MLYTCLELFESEQGRACRSADQRDCVQPCCLMSRDFDLTQACVDLVPCVQVIQTVRSPAVFYCATLNPDPAKESTVLAGASDKKIYQFDLTSGEMIQEYHYHLGAVNTIEYIEENRCCFFVYFSFYFFRRFCTPLP